MGTSLIHGEIIKGKEVNVANSSDSYLPIDQNELNN